jgi:branched-chain amino acid transport system ATP-binding protein
MLLEVKNMSAGYGTVRAVENVSFAVDKGEIVSMIGPNGAGKSTVINAVSGVLAANGGVMTGGEILFEGVDLAGFRTDQLVAMGISLVPEGRRVFSTMTVQENLEMGGYIYYRSQTRVMKGQMDKVWDIFPELAGKKKQRAGTLSTGEQQMLAIGRALMLQPRLLMADEPSMGLSPNYIETIFGKFKDIAVEGTAILLVEQNAEMALDICDRTYVFELGRIVVEGPKSQLLRSDLIKKVYLGVENDVNDLQIKEQGK